MTFSIRAHPVPKKLTPATEQFGFTSESIDTTGASLMMVNVYWEKGSKVKNIKDYESYLKRKGFKLMNKKRSGKRKNMFYKYPKEAAGHVFTETLSKKDKDIKVVAYKK